MLGLTRLQMESNARSQCAHLRLHAQLAFTSEAGIDGARAQKFLLGSSLLRNEEEAKNLL